jgi:hypothetical protein
MPGLKRAHQNEVTRYRLGPSHLQDYPTACVRISIGAGPGAFVNDSLTPLGSRLACRAGWQYSDGGQP